MSDTWWFIIVMCLLGCVDNKESRKRVDGIKATMQACGDLAAECTENYKVCTKSFGETVDLLQDSIDDTKRCHALLERFVGKPKKGKVDGNVRQSVGKMPGVREGL